jgi:hypothetical protein
MARDILAESKAAMAVAGCGHFRMHHRDDGSVVVTPMPDYETRKAFTSPGTYSAQRGDVWLQGHQLPRKPPRTGIADLFELQRDARHLAHKHGVAQELVRDPELRIERVERAPASVLDALLQRSGKRLPAGATVYGFITGPNVRDKFSIFVRDDLPILQHFDTLLHECAHARCFTKWSDESEAAANAWVAAWQREAW